MYVVPPPELSLGPALASLFEPTVALAAAGGLFIAFAAFHRVGRLTLAPCGCLPIKAVFGNQTMLVVNASSGAIAAFGAVIARASSFAVPHVLSAVVPAAVIAAATLVCARLALVRRRVGRRLF